MPSTNIVSFLVIFQREQFFQISSHFSLLSFRRFISLSILCLANPATPPFLSVFLVKPPTKVKPLMHMFSNFSCVRPYYVTMIRSDCDSLKKCPSLSVFFSSQFMFWWARVSLTFYLYLYFSALF